MATNDDRTDRPMTCEICGQTFPSRQTLQVHEREDHSDSAADAERAADEARPADLHAAGPSTGEPPASPVQHGA